MWIMADNAFDLFVIDTYRMITHKKDAIIIVKLLYGAIVWRSVPAKIHLLETYILAIFKYIF